jgi:hypothetical protein
MDMDRGLTTTRSNDKDNILSRSFTAITLMYWLGQERLDTLNKQSLKSSNQVERALIINATCNKLLPTGTVCVDHEIGNCGPLPGLKGMLSRDASLPPFKLSEKHGFRKVNLA